jgi:integrase
MHKKCGGYYYVYWHGGKTIWEHLGRDFSKALLLWAERESQDLKGERTVERALGHYLETESGRLSPETMKAYKRSAARLIAVFGKIGLADLTPNNVYEYVRRYGNIQANRDKALLSATYTAARSWGWHRGDNPAHGVRRNPERPRKRYVTDDEFSTLIEKLPPKLALVAQWAYLTGMSLSDILALRLTDATTTGIQYSRQKTESNPIIIEWSEALREVWREAAGSRIGSQPLFPARGGKHYTVSGFESIWQEAKKKTGIADLKFHDLRRKAGSDVELEHAQKLLTHTDARTTRRHYRAKAELVKPVR